MINEATIEAQFKQATVKGSVATLQFEILTDNADAFRIIKQSMARRFAHRGRAAAGHDFDETGEIYGETEPQQVEAEVIEAEATTLEVTHTEATIASNMDALEAHVKKVVAEYEGATYDPRAPGRQGGQARPQLPQRHQRRSTSAARP